MPYSTPGIPGSSYIYLGAPGHYIQHWCCHRLPSVRSIQLNEGGGLVEILNEDTVVFEDLIEEWQQLANAGPGGLALVYAFSYDSAAHTVTLAANGVFAYTLDDDVAALLGMDSAGAAAASYTSTQTPLGFCYPWAVELSQGRELCDEDVRRYRHGRATAYVTHRGRVRDLRVRLNRGHLEDLQAGPLFQGALRAYDGDETVDLYPLEHREVMALGDVDYFAELVITCLAAESEPFQASGVGREDHHTANPEWRWGQLASGFPFGFSVMYCAKIDGLDTLFVEKGFSGTYGIYTADESLIIDDSAAVGSIVERQGDSGGIGRGFDLLLRLQDTAAVRELFQAPSVRTKVTADYDYAAGWPTTLTVGDTSGLDASGVVHSGTTAIEYTAKPSGTTLTISAGPPHGATKWNTFRGNISASDHMCDVTDRPQFWRGRRVFLYAIGVTGFGRIEWNGSTFADSSALVWSGFVAEEPLHDSDNTWALQCRSFDRRLDSSIVPVASGTVLFSFGSDARLVVDDPNMAIRCMVIGNAPGASGGEGDEVVIPVWPSGSAIGDEVYASTVRTNLSAGWAAAWAAITGLDASFPTIGSLAWRPQQVPDGAGAKGIQWDAYFNLVAVSDATYVSAVTVPQPWGAHPAFQSTGEISPSWAGVSAGPVDTGQAVEVGPMIRMTTGIEVGVLRCVLDSGDPAEIPASGWVILEAEGITETRQYDLVEDDTDHGAGGEVHLRLKNATASRLESYTAGQVLEVSCKFAFGAVGSVPDLMRTLLESSGRGNNGTYDDWDVGYDLNELEVDEDSFDSVLGPSYKGMYSDLLLDTDHSFTRLWSGLLTLSGHAVVPRRYYTLGHVALTAANVGPPDAGYAAWSVTETELAAPLSGGRPIRPTQVRPCPNKLSVHMHRVSSEDDGLIEVRSPQSIIGRGPVTWEPHIYGMRRADVIMSVQVWAHALFSSSATAQVVELDVQPWIEAEVGDQIYIDLPNAYQLWQWSAGEPGYQGNARVLGEQTNLVTGIRTLTVQLDGIVQLGALSPSAPISSWDNALSTATTWLKVPLRYYEVFASFLRDDATFWLVAYLPSEDVATTQEFEISAVAVDAGDCKLTVADNTGVFTVTTAWFLTLPNVAEGTAAQDVYAHNTTEGVWG
uniref:Uncharacterized protein n=1 Tax=viral metagenome TaxID=1070528 RepID=A0A6M3KQA8_9ZZZZ